MSRLRMNWRKAMIRKVGTATGISWRDRWVILQAWVLLLIVDLALRALPFAWVQRVMAMAQRNAEDFDAAESSALVRRLQSLVGIATRNHLYPMRCLQRCLVLQWLLGRRGMVASLRIGVRKEADGLRAHAWLEHAGRAIGDRQSIAASYAPLAARGADR